MCLEELLKSALIRDAVKNLKKPGKIQKQKQASKDEHNGTQLFSFQNRRSLWQGQHNSKVGNKNSDNLEREIYH